MPLDDSFRETILAYCTKRIAPQAKCEIDFCFVTDEQLRAKLGSEFFLSRYIYKLSECLYLDGEFLNAHSKFQIIQYASIYESVINYLLFDRYKDTEEVKGIMSKLEFSKYTDLPNNVSLANADNAEPLFICYKKSIQLAPQNVRFSDKLKVSIELGFISKKISDDIQDIYTLRNGVHIDAALKRNMSYEIEMARLSYRRMRPFLDGIKRHLCPDCIYSKNRRVIIE